MTTQKEIDEAFIATLESIIGVCDKTTSGNVSHNVATIKGKCRNMLQFYKEFPVSPWHSVADGDLPKEPKGDYIDPPFFVKCKNGTTTSAYYELEEDEEDYCFYDDCGCVLDVEFWMEIPQLPKESEVKDE